MCVCFLSIDCGWTSRIQFQWNSGIMFFTLVRAELGQFLIHLKPVWVTIDSLIHKYADLKLLLKAWMLLNKQSSLGFKKKNKTSQNSNKNWNKPNTHTSTAISNFFLRSIWLQLHLVLTHTYISKAYSLDFSDWFMRCWCISATYCMPHNQQNNKPG